MSRAARKGTDEELPGPTGEPGPDRAVPRWRLLPFHRGATELHVALCDSLVRHSAEPTVWWHETEEPTLVLGAGQTTFNAAEAVRRGIRVVRRHSGGTAVFAGMGVLGLDVMLPAGHPLVCFDIVEQYRFVGEAWTAALDSIGVGAKLVSVESARAAAKPDEGVDAILRLACFGSLSPYEVEVGGRKLVGLSQVRRRAGVLIQSGIHGRFDAEGLASLLPGPDRRALARGLDRAAVGLDTVTPAPVSEDRLIAAVQDALTSLFGGMLVPGNWTEDEIGHAANLLSESPDDVRSAVAQL